MDQKRAQEETEDKTHGIRRISHAIAPVARESFDGMFW